MRSQKLVRSISIALVACSLAANAASAESPIGQVKLTTGSVALLRGGVSQVLQPGDRVFQSDVLSTGADGSVGITFADDSVMSLGPDSRLSLDAFRFDTTTHEGVFESSLTQGTLVVKSGGIAKQTPEAMRVRTPAALLGVRGTEFAARADRGHD
jgi:hypothetical protein